ncbi:hypothetical protein Ciccas_003482 [Cichlidogyrus casuarinus]|uniref:G-protein coupled receptors family 1 profile domain-containing protein n=1 Tax=Cichlidogyrus casuarinus TaxID=1844966 RepID=A0ABD2QEQ0_9PLAT
MSLIIAETLVVVLGILFNLLAIFVIVKDKTQRSITNIQLAGLCVADLLHLSQYFSITWPAIFFKKRSKFFCLMHLMCLNMAKYAGTLHLVAMSADRYLVVCQPHFSMRYRKIKYAYYSVLLAWLFPFLLNLMFFWTLPFSSVTFICRHTLNPGANTALQISLVCVFFITPFIVMTVLYSLVLSTLRKKHVLRFKASALLNQYSAQNQTLSFDLKSKPSSAIELEPESAAVKEVPFKQEAEKLAHNGIKKQNRLTRIILTLILVYFFCWGQSFAHELAVTIVALQSNPDRRKEFLPIRLKNYSSIRSLITNVNTAINPILYAFLSKQFRRAVMRNISTTLSWIFPKWRNSCCCPSSIYLPDCMLCGWRIKEADELSNSVLNSAERKVHKSCFNWHYICAWNGMKRVSVPAHTRENYQNRTGNRLSITTYNATEQPHSRKQMSCSEHQNEQIIATV